jgi:metal-sulfur cluster biosynthetic enzyme
MDEPQIAPQAVSDGTAVTGADMDVPVDAVEDGVPAASVPAPVAAGEVVAGAPSGVVDVEAVMDALANVIDPELGLDFVELGLIYGVEIDGSRVHVNYSLTTPGCPIGPAVAEQIEEFVGEVDGVQSVESELTFTPSWTPERMSEDARFALGF